MELDSTKFGAGSWCCWSLPSGHWEFPSRLNAIYVSWLLAESNLEIVQDCFSFLCAIKFTSKSFSEAMTVLSFQLLLMYLPIHQPDA